MKAHEGPTALILTEWYPYAGGDHFLDNEISHWSRSFARVLLVPAHSSGSRLTVPEGVVVLDGLARQNGPMARAVWAARALLTLGFWAELWALRRRAAAVPALAVLKARARLVRSRYVLRRYLAGQQVDLVYCYWMNPDAYAMASLADGGARPVLIARTHGIDLYEDRWPGSYLPLRDQYIGHFDIVHPVSEDGRRHLLSAYPEQANHIEVARLGVARALDWTGPCAPHELHIVSTASCVPVKRLERIPGALSELARRIPDIEIRWTHIGGGPQLPNLRALTERVLGDRVKVQFLGAVAANVVLEFYRQNHIDLILSTSDYEGVPVSLMEAMAQGIPAVAPQVGGIPELVGGDGEGGWLLPRGQLDTQSIAAVLEAAWKQAKDPATRAKARARVRRDFDAEDNYAEMCARALRLVNE